jgi:phospholipase/carboxylesterase
MENLTLDGPQFGPVSGGAPTQLVVLFHGLGADGNDLIGLAEEIAPALPDALFISPHAPFPSDMSPMGRQWFSLRYVESHDALFREMTEVAGIVNAYLDGLLAQYQFPAEKLVLGGFSQGAMLSLHLGLRRACAGVLGYSGALIGSEHLAAQLTHKPPVCLIHGEADPVVPVDASKQAAQMLESLGVPTELHLRPRLPHSIDNVGLELGTAFLHRVLG